MQKLNFPVKRLFLLHVFIIVISNYTVQIPIEIFNIESTVGTFTFPFVFITTDLTVRIFGSTKARYVIFYAMIPALIISYIIGTIFEHGHYQGIENLSSFSLFVFRIAAASFGAYVLGQLLDITVFQKLRQLPQWYLAPAASSIVGNMLDTFTFYFVSFYRCDDPYMAANWVSLGIVDYIVKLIVCLVLFVPIYGIFLSFIAKVFFKCNINNLRVMA